MGSLIKSILTNTCTITSYAVSDGWTAPASTTATSACRFERYDGYVPGITGQMVAFIGRVILPPEATLDMTDKVTVNNKTYNVLKVTETLDLSGNIVRIDGYLG